jgi:hypothetical protein
MAAKVGRNDPCPCGSGYKAKACCLAGGPADAAFILVSQPGPMARLAARWLSAARRRYERGLPLGEEAHQRAAQFLRVCRGWNPDAYDAAGRPSGDLAALAVAFNGRAAAVFAIFAVGLAHLLLDQPEEARAWLDIVSGPHEEQMLAALTAAGLPTAPFTGLPAHILSWAGDRA